jgi:membrane protease YdiL (CAAX protease family)
MRVSSIPATRGRSLHPVLVALGLLIAFEVVANGATLILDAVSSLDGKARDVITEVILAAGVLALIAALGWWRSTGFAIPRRDWRHLRLLALPFALTLLPLVGGVKASIDGGTIVLLLVGYAFNSLAEDGMFRGIVPRVLRDRGLLVAVVVSSLFFGLAHFGNIISRPDQAVAITAAQAFGAFTQGIGLVALRLVNNTIWPVMLIHLLGDLFGQVGAVPIVLANVVESTVMLIYGIWIYRRYRSDLERSLAVDDR